VVLLSLRVSDGLAETKSQSIAIGAVSLDPLVVLVEVVNALDGFEHLLEALLFFRVEATKVFVEASAECFVVLSELVFNHLADGVENHCDVESNHTSLKADFIAGLFQDDLFALEFVVGVVELGDLTDDPEGLSVELLLQVSVENVVQLVSIADRGIGEDITQGGTVVLNTLIRLLLEGLQFLIENLVGFGL